MFLETLIYMCIPVTVVSITFVPKVNILYFQRNLSIAALGNKLAFSLIPHETRYINDRSNPARILWTTLNPQMDKRKSKSDFSPNRFKYRNI